MEERILSIRELVKKLDKTRLTNPSASSFKSTVDKILEILDELSSKGKSEIYSTIADDLRQNIHGEIARIERFESRARMRNATVITQKEFQNALRRASEKLESVLALLLVDK